MAREPLPDAEHERVARRPVERRGKELHDPPVAVQRGEGLEVRVAPLPEDQPFSPDLGHDRCFPQASHPDRFSEFGSPQYSHFHTPASGDRLPAIARATNKMTSRRTSAPCRSACTSELAVMKSPTTSRN